MVHDRYNVTEPQCTTHYSLCLTGHLDTRSPAHYTRTHTHSHRRVGHSTTSEFSRFRAYSPLFTHCTLQNSSDCRYGIVDSHMPYTYIYTIGIHKSRFIRQFQYFNHTSDCSVQWSNRVGNPERTVKARPQQALKTTYKCTQYNTIGQ